MSSCHRCSVVVIQEKVAPSKKNMCVEKCITTPGASQVCSTWLCWCMSSIDMSLCTSGSDMILLVTSLLEIFLSDREEDRMSKDMKAVYIDVQRRTMIVV